jgi:SNF2 family DNA or RNA helicase
MNGHRESADNVADEPFVIRPYQKEGIDWLREHPCGLLGDDMGLGKGLQALRADPRGTPVLVCCPASVKGVWRTEAAKFRPDLKVTIIRGRFVRLCEEHAVGRHSLDPKKGSKRARPIAAPDEDDDELEDGEPGAPRAPTVHKCAECPPRKKKLAVGRFSTFRWPGPDEVVVLNPQIFPKSWPGAPRGLRVVLDEVHAYSYADTTQTRRVRSLVVQALKVGGGAWGLSGTPMWGKPPTLWCVLTTLQLHPWADRDEFDAAFGGTRDNWGKLTWPEKPPTDVRSRLASVMLRRLKADVLTDLPPLTMQDVVVEVDVRARSAADKVLALLDELGLPIEALIAAEAKADFAATALDPEARKKLSPEQWDEARHRLLALYSEARESLVRAKLPAILEFIEDQYEQSDEQLVVFSAHRIVVETLRERPGWAGIIGGMTPSAREAVLDRFASREVRYLTATIQAVGVGINKLVCCSHAILADWTLVPAQNAQVRDRLHRIGQTNPVLVRRFVADHPLDRRVLASLEETAARIEHTIGGTA